MAKHGVLMERDNFIASKAMNRAGISALAIDGGCPVVEGAIVSGNDELYTLTAYVTAGTKVGIAYNPSRPLDDVGYPVRSMDDRTYTNRIGDVVDYFIPEVGMEFGVQMANITGSIAPVVGKFLECTNGTLLYTIKDTQTASVPSFEVVQIMSANYPTGDFTSDKEPVYIVKCRYNGL
jgi:hypothetical protein